MASLGKPPERLSLNSLLGSTKPVTTARDPLARDPLAGIPDGALKVQQLKRLAEDAQKALQRGDRVRAGAIGTRIQRNLLQMGIAPEDVGLSPQGLLLTEAETRALAAKDAAPAVTLASDQKEGLYRMWEQFSGRGMPQRVEPDGSTPDPNVFVLDGPAGCGKSTLASEVLRTVRLLKSQGVDVEVVPPWYPRPPTGRLWVPRIVAMCAPTNKAALRLQEITGQCAGTHHSIAYERPMTDEETGLLTGFVKREEGSAMIHRGAMLIEDEASMISRVLRRDMVAALPTQVKRLVIGDHCQLDPPQASAGYNLQMPDFRLTQVHRQQGGSPVLDAATEIRTKKCRIVPRILREWGVPLHDVTYNELGQLIANGQVPVLLVATNASRWWVNAATRRALGRPARPAPGDRVVAFTTNKAILVANSEMGTVKFSQAGRDVAGEETWMVKVDWDGRGEQVVICPKKSWNPGGEQPWQPEACTAPVSRIRQAVGMDDTFSLLALQPAYAITVHKFQGSEAPYGGILLESSRFARAEDWRRDYTALTRFKEAVYFFRVSAPGSVRSNTIRKPGM